MWNRYIPGVCSPADVHGGGVLLSVARARVANGAIMLTVSDGAGMRACGYPGRHLVISLARA
jgi:hypothetical protein